MWPSILGPTASENGQGQPPQPRGPMVTRDLSDPSGVVILSQQQEVPR